MTFGDMRVFDNRELSWLKFNERVLEEAQDSANPFCERLSFLAIFQSNLDEFAMVRCGALGAAQKLDVREDKTGLTCAKQLELVRAQMRRLLQKRDETYQNLMGKAGALGMSNLNFAELTASEQERMRGVFFDEVKPFLSAQIVTARQPFPFLRGKEIYAVVELVAKDGQSSLGLVPCSTRIGERMIFCDERKKRFMLLEELILHFVQDVFVGFDVKGKSLIRVLRSADIDLDDVEGGDEDYRKAVEGALKMRPKLSPVELDYTRNIDEGIIEKMCGYLNIGRDQAFHFDSPFDLSFLSQVRDALRGDKLLFYDHRSPQAPACVNPTVPMIEQVRQHDVLLSYPYEKMSPFIDLLSEAAADPNVVSIKMTLYRVAQDSKIVEELIEAAERGKEVVAVVELRARFDEENNIRWSRQLEEAGCQVIYGLERLKVHSKLCLITRRGEGSPEYITQVGTGNYNENTSRVYTDYSLMSSDRRIGEEALKVFNCLACDQTVEQSEHLLVSPHTLKAHVIQMTDEQIELAKAGGDGYIGLKLNSLTDKDIIDKLIEASKAGVKIQMVVRGICCLKAGVKGETDNVEVISIVGRFLEHSRIYIFGKGEGSRVYISSADFMTRNTTRRVEVAAPIYDERIKERILADFELYLHDNVKARHQSEGVYTKVQATGEAVNAQEEFYKRAYEQNPQKG